MNIPNIVHDDVHDDKATPNPPQKKSPFLCRTRPIIITSMTNAGFMVRLTTTRGRATGVNIIPFVKKRLLLQLQFFDWGNP